MMFYLTIVYFLCFTTIQAQMRFPSYCTEIWRQGSPDPYPRESTAGAIQMFCSMTESISNCMDANKENSTESNLTFDWALGAVFEKTVFKNNAACWCHFSLPNVPPLDCLSSRQDQSCGYEAGLSDIHDQYKSGNTTYDMAKVSICGILRHTAEQCYSNCSDETLTLLTGYYAMFEGICNGTNNTDLRTCTTEFRTSTADFRTTTAGLRTSATSFRTSTTDFITHTDGLRTSSTGSSTSTDGLRTSTDGLRTSTTDSRTSTTDLRTSTTDSRTSTDGLRTSTTDSRTNTDGIRTSATGSRTSTDGLRTSTDGLRTSTTDSRTSTTDLRTSSTVSRTSTDGLRTSTTDSRTNTDGIRTSATGSRTSTDGLRTSTDGLRTSTTDLRTSTTDSRTSTDGLRTSTTDSRTSTDGLRTSTTDFRTGTDDLRPSATGFRTSTTDFKASTTVFKTSSFFPEWIQDSAFFLCAVEADIITEIVEQISQTTVPSLNLSSTDSIMNFVMSIFKDKLCLKRDGYSRCVIERLTTTRNNLDKMLLEMFNFDSLIKVLEILCSLINDMLDATNNAECTTDSLAKQVSMCTALYLPDIFNTSASVGDITMPNDFVLTDFKDPICRGIKGMLDCSLMSLSRCYSHYTKDITKTIDAMMSESCYTLSNQGVPGLVANPQASVFMQCGMPIYYSMAKVDQNMQLPPQDVSTMIIKFVDITCRNAEWYLTCVDDRLSASPNYLDRVLREILDISDVAVRKYVISTVCTKHLQDIRRSMQCMVSKIVPNQDRQKRQISAEGQQSAIYKCVARSNLSQWDVLSNPRNMPTDGSLIRSKFCGPIDAMIKCAKTYLGTCDQKVAPLLDSVPRAFLRTDCYGIKPDIRKDVSTSYNNSGTTLLVAMKTTILLVIVALRLLTDQI